MKTIKSFQKLITLFAVIMVSTRQLSAQLEDIISGATPAPHAEGYVILSNGETLYGEITWAFKYVENNPVKIYFYAKNGEKFSYQANEIVGFGNRMKIWKEGNPNPLSLEMEDYVSLPSYKKGVPVFMKRFIDGMITVYQNRSSIVMHSVFDGIEKTRINGSRFSFSFDDGLSIGPTFNKNYHEIYKKIGFSSYYVSKNGGQLVKVKKDDYEVLFKTLFGDCPAIGQEIERNPDLMKFKYFTIVAEVYNQVCQVEAGP